MVGDPEGLADAVHVAGGVDGVDEGLEGGGRVWQAWAMAVKTGVPGSGRPADAGPAHGGGARGRGAALEGVAGAGAPRVEADDVEVGTDRPAGSSGRATGRIWLPLSPGPPGLISRVPCGAPASGAGARVTAMERVAGHGVAVVERDRDGAALEGGAGGAGGPHDGCRRSQRGQGRPGGGRRGRSTAPGARGRAPAAGSPGHEEAEPQPDGESPGWGTSSHGPRT